MYEIVVLGLVAGAAAVESVVAMVRAASLPLALAAWLGDD